MQSKFKKTFIIIAIVNILLLFFIGVGLSIITSKTVHATVTTEEELTLKWQKNAWKINFKNYEIHSNIHTIEENASKFSRHKTMKEKVGMIESLTKMLGIEKAFDLVFWKFDNTVDQILKNIEKPYKDATISFNSINETFSVVKEEVGFKVNKEQFYQDLLNTLKTKNNGATLNIKVEKLKPRFTQEQLSRVGFLRSQFVTSYLTSGAERKHNIRLASSKFNGIRINPGEALSFNTTTGKRTKENGYKEAKIIASGLFIDGFGGGVCQVSTTLFNAFALSGLEIIEARSHSMPVSYVEKGQDAMVNQGTSDLKVKNNFNTPVFIKTEIIDNSNLSVKIFGEDLAGMTYELESEIVETIPPMPTRLIIDIEKKYIHLVKFKDERVCIHEGTEGFKTKTYLVKYKENRQVARQLIRRDLYKPSATIIVEGTEDRSLISEQ